MLDGQTRRSNAAFEAPDGLPLPSPYLVYLVTGQWSLKAFFENGLLGIESIHEMLEKNGIDSDQIADILDFGCGCGRVLRHWRRPDMFGCDYNPKLVQWCREELPIAGAKVNSDEPPLEWPDESFDFIYAISVFTHLRPELQVEWFKELRRVLRPGGHLYFSAHGTSFIATLSEEDQERFRSGDLVTVRSKYSGSNFCGAYHPKAYVDRAFGPIMKLVDFAEEGARDARQDAYLFQKV